jgi:hypothetical protein
VTTCCTFPVLAEDNCSRWSSCWTDVRSQSTTSQPAHACTWWQRACFVAYPALPKSATNGSKCWNWFNSGDQQRGRGEPSLDRPAGNWIARKGIDTTFYCDDSYLIDNRATRVPVVAQVSSRFIAPQMEARVFSSAQTAA